MDGRIRYFESFPTYRYKVNNALELLREFKQEYPFKAHPELIDTLTIEDLYIKESSHVGSFFNWIVFKLKDLGYLGSLRSIRSITKV